MMLSFSMEQVQLLAFFSSEFPRIQSSSRLHQKLAYSPGRHMCVGQQLLHVRDYPARKTCMCHLSGKRVPS